MATPARLPAAPGPRPARSFTTERAQRWVLISAILTAVVYAFRRAVEPTTGAGQPTGGPVSRLAGTGRPPASLEHWAVSYTVAYLTLAILALGAPEAAASIAGVLLVANLLTNGSTIAADITGLQGPADPGTVAKPASTSTAPAASVSAPGTTNAPNLFQDPLATFPPVRDPFGVKLPNRGAS